VTVNNQKLDFTCRLILRVRKRVMTWPPSYVCKTEGVDQLIDMMNERCGDPTREGAGFGVPAGIPLFGVIKPSISVS